MISAYIEHWGADNYLRWCSPETRYETLVDDIQYWWSQVHYYNTPKTNIAGLRILTPDPYARKLRDLKGKLIPEPSDTSNLQWTGGHLDEVGVDETFISEHGIVQYVLSTTCKVPLPHLLTLPNVGRAQRLYIQSQKL